MLGHKVNLTPFLSQLTVGAYRPPLGGVFMIDIIRALKNVLEKSARDDLVA
jgi:hypothetical protein